MTMIVNGVSTKTVQGHFLFSPVLWKAIKRPSPTDIFPKQIRLLSQNKKILSSTKAVMKLREQISIVCDPFQTKILPSFPLRFSGSGTTCNYSLTAPLKHNQPDLSSSLCPTKHSGNPFWMSLFPNPTLQCWNKPRDQKKHQSRFYYSLRPRTWTYGRTTKKPALTQNFKSKSNPNQIHSVWYSKSWH